MTLRGHFEQMGLERGILQGKQYITIQLIKEGFLLDKIAELTGLHKDMLIDLERQVS